MEILAWRKVHWEERSPTIGRRAYSLLFFCFICFKLIRPGQTIESINIKQNSRLEALRVEEHKMSKMLNAFGDSCLSIFDGLDEHDYGTNET